MHSHEKRRAKLALADEDCQYDAGIMEKLEGLDDATAQHVIVSIEDRGLSWAQRTLWLMEENPKGAL